MSGKDVVKRGGVKNDTGKAPLHFMVPDAIAGVCRVFAFGAEKYEPENWKEGIAYTRVWAAAMRHLFLWFFRQECDDESGLSHLDHASCDIQILQAYTKRGKTYREFDDRPKKDRGLKFPL